jgi:hypothetical protein
MDESRRCPTNVKVIYCHFPHLVNLIRENPRYTKMTPEEILGKFVSGRMMVKEARYVDDAANRPLPLYEPQRVALKAQVARRRYLAR